MRRARVDPHGEIVGLDRERFLDAQRVIAAVGDREFAEQHRQPELGFDHRELPPDTGADAVAERLVGMRVARRFRLGEPAIDIEVCRSIPHARMAVERGSHDIDRPILAHRKLPADHRVFERPDREAWRGRPEPQRFLEDTLDDVELGDVGHLGALVARQDAIDLGIGLGEDVRVTEQLVEGEAQHSRSRLMPRDQEGQNLVADVEVGQRFSALWVLRGEHQVEQVAPVGGVGATFGDDLVDQRVHGADRRRQPRLARLGEALLDG